MTVAVNDVTIVRSALLLMLEYKINLYVRARNFHKQGEFERNLKLAKQVLSELDFIHPDKHEPGFDHLRNDSNLNFVP